MPSATPQLASAMLFFLAALRGGEVRNWLGRDGANLLERMGRGDLLNRLAAPEEQRGPNPRGMGSVPCVVGPWKPPGELSPRT